MTQGAPKTQAGHVRGSSLWRARRVLVLAIVAVCTATIGTGSGPAASIRAASPPPDPTCRDRGVWRAGEIPTSREIQDVVCGTNRKDRYRLLGGGDYFEGYDGDDTIRANNGMPDQIKGGPDGRQGDTAIIDPCDKDNIRGVEHVKVVGKRCEATEPYGQRSLQADAELPYWSPVAECWTEEDGTRRMIHLLEPTMRALDTTNKIEFQTVAWQAIVLKQVDGGWEVYVEGDWYWDRTYDLQVEAFPGNFWRDFKTNRRMFESYEIDSPGVYVLAVRYHWYESDRAPATDTESLARAHYGDRDHENEDHSACVFPEATG